jgi:hypothetical protein
VLSKRKLLSTLGCQQILCHAIFMFRELAWMFLVVQDIKYFWHPSVPENFLCVAKADLGGQRGDCLPPPPSMTAKIIWALLPPHTRLPLGKINIDCLPLDTRLNPPMLCCVRLFYWSISSKPSQRIPNGIVLALVTFLMNWYRAVKMVLVSICADREVISVLRTVHGLTEENEIYRNHNRRLAKCI